MIMSTKKKNIEINTKKKKHIYKVSNSYVFFLDFFECLGLLLPDLVNEGVLLLLFL